MASHDKGSHRLFGSSGEPAVILSAIYRMICINRMIYDLEDKRIALFK